MGAYNGSMNALALFPCAEGVADKAAFVPSKAATQSCQSPAGDLQSASEDVYKRQQYSGARKTPGLAPRLAQQPPGLRDLAAIESQRRQFAGVMGGNRARRRRPGAGQPTVHIERLRPIVLALVDAAQRVERRGAQPPDLADLLKKDVYKRQGRG